MKRYLLVFTAISIMIFDLGRPDIIFGGTMRYPMLATKMIKVDSVNTRYADTGSGEAVILIHGFPETLQGWRKNVPELAKHFRVIAFDMVGFGGSDKVDWGFDCSRLADFTKKLMDELKIPKAHIVGTDTGSVIALAFAEKYPDSVNKLVIFSGSAYADSISAKDVQLMMLPVIGDIGFMVFGKMGLAGGIKKGFYRPEAIEQEIIDEYLNALSSWESRKIALKLMRHLGDRMEEMLEKVKRNPPPALILWSDHEKYFYPWVPKKFNEDLKGSKLEYIKGSGHFIQEEQPDIFNQKLVEFFSNTT